MLEADHAGELSCNLLYQNSSQSLWQTVNGKSLCHAMHHESAGERLAHSSLVEAKPHARAGSCQQVMLLDWRRGCRDSRG